MSDACIPSYKSSFPVNYVMWGDSRYVVRRHYLSKEKRKLNFPICGILVSERKENCRADFNPFSVTLNLQDIDNIHLIAGQGAYWPRLAH